MQKSRRSGRTLRGGYQKRGGIAVKKLKGEREGRYFRGAATSHTQTHSVEGGHGSKRGEEGLQSAAHAKGNASEKLQQKLLKEEGGDWSSHLVQ